MFLTNAGNHREMLVERVVKSCGNILYLCAHSGTEKSLIASPGIPSLDEDGGERRATAPSLQRVGEDLLKRGGAGIRLKRDVRSSLFFQFCKRLVRLLVPIAVAGATASTASLAFAQSVRITSEPSQEQVRTGNCRVRVCTDFDFGDHVFRVYASGRTISTRYIPKGACTCDTVKRASPVDFNDHLVLNLETSDGTSIPNVSLMRERRPGEERFRRVLETSHRRFERESVAFAEMPSFTWEGDDFRTFRIFQRTQGSAVGPAIEYFYFVPRTAQFRFRGRSQPIAFFNALGVSPETREFRRDGPRMAAQVRLTDTIQLFQFFTPRLIPSEKWIETMEQAAELIDTRLIQKPR